MPQTASFIENNRYDPVTGCWNWTGAGDRYGVMRYNGKNELVHRLSAHFYLGYDLDSPLRVLHKCDNGLCFNPKHLFIGTQLENMMDMIAKGRHRASNQISCKFGHPRTLENLRPNGKGCRVCHNVQEKERNRCLRD